jgi:hypothetical protein
MTKGTSQHMLVYRVVSGILAVALLVGPAAVSADPGAAGDEFSLRHIPEALPLASATASGSGGWNGDGEEGWYQDTDRPPSEEPSMTRAILYSLLLPGLGDWYAGEKNRAKIFFIADATLWVAFFAFQIQGHELEDGYKEFAATYAGLSSTNHSDDFYSTMGQYDSSDDYEASFKMDSRLDLWPDVGYDALDRYYLDNRLADFEEWGWDSFEKRVDFRQQRSSSRVAYRRSGYVLAAAALNRVIASLFAYQAVKSSRGAGKGGDAGGASSGGYRLDISSPPIGARGDFTATVSLIRSF